MNLHEYQAKELLKKYGVPVQEGLAASTPHEAEEEAAHGIRECRLAEVLGRTIPLLQEPGTSGRSRDRSSESSRSLSQSVSAPALDWR